MKKAFTLAEVLITLGIIGVISAITIPTLLTKVRYVRDSAILKEDFSILKRKDNRVIAIDATTAYSKKVNVLVIENEEIINE